jgi:hypothetical protein
MTENEWKSWVQPLVSVGLQWEFASDAKDGVYVWHPEFMSSPCEGEWVNENHIKTLKTEVQDVLYEIMVEVRRQAQDDMRPW